MAAGIGQPTSGGQLIDIPYPVAYLSDELRDNTQTAYMLASRFGSSS